MIYPSHLKLPRRPTVSCACMNLKSQDMNVENTGKEKGNMIWEIKREMKKGVSAGTAELLIVACGP